jgi:hypothetical protein
MAIRYPLAITFRFLALSPEVQVRDAADQLLLQVKQKLFTLREDTTVFADEQKSVPLYRIKADRIIGFGATHTITRLKDNAVVGSVKADGLRSIWQARYSISDAQGRLAFSIREENPWIKVLDAVLGEIPFVGPFVALFINPRYLMHDEHGTLRYRIVKRVSLLSRLFTIEPVEHSSDDDLDERLVALALIQVIFLERGRD